MANMDEKTFVATVNAHSAALNPDGSSGGDLWDSTLTNDRLSIRAAAFRLRDLRDLLPDKFSGAGALYTRDELAAAGYNTGTSYLADIATGKYGAKYNTSATMGPDATNYVGMYNGMYNTANNFLCSSGVLAC
jgi:hypothetical protein